MNTVSRKEAFYQVVAVNFCSWKVFIEEFGEKDSYPVAEVQTRMDDAYDSSSTLTGSI